MTLVIKGAEKGVLRKFKAEVARRGLSLPEAFEEAVRCWLSFKDKSVFGRKRFEQCRL
ncbi:MAG: hypothetical protein ACUVQY_08365 [Thermoproteota archaeon]